MFKVKKIHRTKLRPNFRWFCHGRAKKKPNFLVKEFHVLPWGKNLRIFISGMEHLGKCGLSIFVLIKKNADL